MTDNPAQTAFPHRGHNHRACIADAIEAAERVCDENGQRFTQLRRRVLEIVWNRHAPVGAYEILDELRQDHRSAAPPTVYRALDFLLANGLDLKIESLNAFVGCGHPDGTHVGQFLICGKCRQVGELDDPDIAALIARKAASVGFDVSRQTIEVQGLCRDCGETARA